MLRNPVSCLSSVSWYPRVCWSWNHTCCCHRSIKIGNWAIEVCRYVNLDEHGGHGIDGGPLIYVSVTEHSAEWGITPLWYKDSGKPVKMTQEGDSSGSLPGPAYPSLPDGTQRLYDYPCSVSCSWKHSRLLYRITNISGCPVSGKEVTEPWKDV